MTITLLVDASALGRVHEDENLWANVLSAVPLVDLYAASSTSRFHRSLMRSSRAHVTHLSISMERGLPAATSTAGFNDGAQPTIVVVENRSRRDAHRIRLPVLPSQSVPRAGKSPHHRHLLRICSCYPSLKGLRLDVSPTPAEAGVAQTNVYGVERLIDVVSWMSRSAVQVGPGSREAGRQGGRGAGRQGGREAGRQGSREAGRQGG